MFYIRYFKCLLFYDIAARFDKVPRNTDTKFSAQDLPFLNQELKVTFYGSTVCRNDGEPERMPRLEEVFQQFSSIPINLDIKGEDEELLVQVS